jgi:fatty-acyl-CoA synthase
MAPETRNESIAMEQSAYDRDLDRNPANFQPLTPLSFLKRAATVFPDRTAVIDGAKRFSYREFYGRCRRLASILAARGVGRGDTVSVMLANTPPMLDAHYGVPMAKAVLHAINTRLDAAVIAFMLDHADTKVLIFDREFAPTIRDALGQASVRPYLVIYAGENPSTEPEVIEADDYEDLIAAGDPDHHWSMPDDEWDAISLNYTSGTTGNPKGVVYHHRGAYLQAQSNALACAMPKHAVYLWTLPMFHCNGWGFPWTLSVIAGTHVCLRSLRQKPLWDALADHDVTHLCGAPIVMSTILATPAADKRQLDHRVEFFTGGAPPPEAVLAAMEEHGFNVTHLYGLTETYGPAAVNEWRTDWDRLELADRARLKARQGVGTTALDSLAVIDPDTMQPVAAGGQAIGEVMMRGNSVMKGYLKNPQATAAAFAGGWFHSGDLGVMHDDAYVQLKDRSKDIIISGGENISSIEVEEALYKHAAVALAAVVAKPDDRWGESPCAFVELREGASASATELIAWCRDHMAGFKVPRHVVFAELPKTSTGKIQKFILREIAKDL